MPSYNYIRNSSKDIYKPNLSYRPQQGTIVVNEDTTLDVVLIQLKNITIQFSNGSWNDSVSVSVEHNSNVYNITNGQVLNLYCMSGEKLKLTFTSITGDLIEGTINGDIDISTGDGYNVYECEVVESMTLNISMDYNLCCVPYYSQILYPNDLTKSAEDVKIGDVIMGYNESNNTYEEVEVLGIIKKSRNDLCKIIFEDDTFMELTPDHPILTDYGWSAYKPETSTAYESMGLIHQLATQQKVLQLNGEYKQIKEIQLNILEQPIIVYTFNTTEGVDTYIAENCVVHNAISCF